MSEKVSNTKERDLPDETKEEYMERIEKEGEQADFHILGTGLTMPLVQRTIKEARSLARDYVNQSTRNVSLVVKTNKWGGVSIKF